MFLCRNGITFSYTNLGAASCYDYLAAKAAKLNFIFAKYGFGKK
jgi:hypothetical protein